MLHRLCKFGGNVSNIYSARYCVNNVSGRPHERTDARTNKTKTVASGYVGRSYEKTIEMSLKRLGLNRIIIGLKAFLTSLDPLCFIWPTVMQQSRWFLQHYSPGITVSPYCPYSNTCLSGECCQLVEY